MDETGKMKDIALLGSVLGNIFQAFEQASKQRDLATLRLTLKKATVDRNYLMKTIKEWQKAYSSLKAKTDSLEEEFKRLNKAFLAQKEEINKLKKENDELRKGQGEKK